MARRVINLAAAAALAWLAGCASVPPTAPLSSYDPASGYRYELLDDPDNSEELFVILTFSGGGTRAAALSYGVLEKLRETWVKVDGQRRNLLREVDVISSVSGGSFTAAYYALYGDAIFDSQGPFQKDFLYRNVQGELTRKLYNPYNWWRLMSPTFGRIELAQELYEDRLFGETTFRELAQRRRRPFLMINATDMAKGNPFTFIQSQFDPMCADLGSVPIARAVAASSNFPIAFSPLAVNAYPGTCRYQEPGWVEGALKDVDTNPRRYASARTLRTYQEPARRYAHLLDGGVADNIGLRGPLASLFSGDVSWSVLRKMGLERIKKLVVIVVDAKNEITPQFDESPGAPGVFAVIDTIATTPLDSYSFDTVELLRQVMADRARAQREQPDLYPVDLYRIYVGFDHIADERERAAFQQTPTAFRLPRARVDALRQVGGRLLAESDCFQKLTGAPVPRAAGRRERLCPY